MSTVVQLHGKAAAGPTRVDPVAEGRTTQAGTVRRAQAGDTAAFEGLYRATVGRVYAVCLRMTGDPGAAEELTQEAFVRAWQRLGSFRGDSEFSTWMHRVTVNVVLGHRRRVSRRPEGARAPEEAAEESSRPEAPDPPLSVDLERAIARLPERARQVFVLYDVEGHSHEEISRLAGVAVGTSKAHLSRARRLLRKALTR